MGQLMSTRRKKDATTHSGERRITPEATSDTGLDICSCPPVSSLCLLSTMEQDNETQEWDDEEHNQVLPVPSALNSLLRTRLQTLFSSTSSLTILLLHVSQLEHIHLTPETDIVHKRRRYHPSASIVEQVLMNVRRAIRMEDSVYLDIGKAAAIIFPNVDQEGAYTILERVFNSVNLLQAETITPPLTHETDIVLGIGSYPEQGPSLEHVLSSAGRVVHRLTLRPAITMHLWDEMPMGESTSSFYDTLDDTEQDNENMRQQNTLSSSLVKASTLPSEPSSTHDATPIPFLRLPATLSTRLKNLLTYKIAVQLRCVPMGRDHNRLTVAMADPTDTQAVQKLQKVTGMRIFPVACDNDALDALLAEQW